MPKEIFGRRPPGVAAEGAEQGHAGPGGGAGADRAAGRGGTPISHATIARWALTAVAGTQPMLTSPGAMPPTRKAGTPIAAGSPSGTSFGSPARSLMCCSKTAEWLICTPPAPARRCAPRTCAPRTMDGFVPVGGSRRLQRYMARPARSGTGRLLSFHAFGGTDASRRGRRSAEARNGEVDGGYCVARLPGPY
jgi:hypothetical protein